jgi:predicted HTH transcriptional regulator
MKAVYIRTVEELVAVVKTPESLVLEFKKTIDKWNTPKTVKGWEKLRAEAQQETCRDIAQFANTNGGCLLIGVQERVDPATQLKVADGICGVNDPEGMKDWIEKAICNYLVPATFSHDIKEIHDPMGIVLAVNIPASIHTVALWNREQHTIEVVRRHCSLCGRNRRTCRGDKDVHAGGNIRAICQNNRRVPQLLPD